MIAVVLDTNVFVGAGFNRRSSSARLLDAVRGGRLRMVWQADTSAETRRILTKIPPLSWDAVADLFRAQDEWTAPLDTGPFAFVTDPGDRKYAALSAAAGVPVVSSDDDLLAHRGRIAVLKPGEAERLVG